jgi:hypothetical protein
MQHPALVGIVNSTRHRSHEPCRAFRLHWGSAQCRSQIRTWYQLHANEPVPITLAKFVKGNPVFE